ncbi:hypothetical protein WJX73_006335 [Symbiochloris irregularis]|uniref:Exocyst subunit Exo70 family protein n=1 Tax=Symbiochloris irregularis TaxID=706552 RepID=A0AAW1NMD5_9CHLO
MTGATARAAALKDALTYSESLAREADGVLESYTARLSELSDMVAPVSEKTQVLTQARLTISRAQQQTTEVLQHLAAAKEEEATVLAGPRSDSDAFFASMDRLNSALLFFSKYRSLQMSEQVLAMAGKLRREGLRLSSEEFQSVLRRNSSAAASLNSGAGAPIDINTLMPESPRVELKRLAETMLTAGDTSCIKMFADARQKFIERALPPEVSSVEDVSARVGTMTIDGKARAWSLGLRAATRQASAERLLANAIFDAPHDAVAFGEAASRTIQSLVRAAQSVVSAMRTPEKVGCLTDMGEELEGALPALVLALTGTATRPLWEALQSLSVSLQAEARASLAEFESSLAREGTKPPAPDGGVASSASHTLTVLRRVFARPSAAKRLFGRLDSGISSRTGRHVPLDQDPAQAVRLLSMVTRILDELKAGLAARAKTCKDPALEAIFMMNNLNFVIKAVEGSQELGGLGVDWVDLNRPLVQQFAGEYFRASWQPMLEVVRETPQGLGDGRALKWDREKVLIKERFTRVNADLTTLHMTQKGWTIPDSTLRDSIKDAICTQFLPMYQGFLQRFRSLPFSKTPEKYLRFQVADIQKMVQEDFFASK